MWAGKDIDSNPSLGSEEIKPGRAWKCREPMGKEDGVQGPHPRLICLALQGSCLWECCPREPWGPTQSQEAAVLQVHGLPGSGETQLFDQMKDEQLH